MDLLQGRVELLLGGDEPPYQIRDDDYLGLRVGSRVAEAPSRQRS